MANSRIEVNNEIKNQVIQLNENRASLLSSRASGNSSFIRRHYSKPEELLRSPFSRDSDRILHSKGYSRYIDKTQVFFLVDNDHITHRVLHVQLVSKIARTIGRALGLNEDLIEAISLGHDIGHVPYGHLGESILSKLCQEYEIGKFRHNVQAIQFLDKIENKDLTLQTLDGILCHDGEVHNANLTPDQNLSWDNFDLKLEKGENIIPSTYEGCVVRFADNIAYLGRDLQDARELNLLNDSDLQEFPSICKTLLDIHMSDCEDINWIIIDTLIKDIINSSYNEESISFSEDMSHCVKELKDYNYEKIYNNPLLYEPKPIIEKMFETLFNTFLEDFENNKSSSPIYSDMYDCPWINEDYKDEVKEKPAILVRDYIAGMTDRYFDKKYYGIIMPKRREDFK